MRAILSSGISELESLVGSLEQQPPASRSEFEELYNKHIRGAIKQIEGSKKRQRQKVLRILDSDFRDVLIVYTPSNPNAPTEKSVFAQEYSFFLGGLKTYLKAKQGLHVSPMV